MSRLLRAGAPFVLVLALAAGLRFVGAGLASDGARLRPRFDGDGDVLYHAARARRLAMTGDPLWFDPALDPPLGARVLSPPLLEAIIAGAASAATAGAPTDAGVDAASALVPVALGVLAVGAVAALGALLLGPGHGLLAAFGLAISWSAIFYSMVGRSDQHALEQLVFLAVLLAAAWAVDCPRGRGRRPRALLLGLALAVSAWAWQGSALTLLVLSLAAAVDHLLGGAREPEGRRLAAVLAEGGLAGALLLALSIGLLGPPGALRSGAVEGVSALAVATCAGAAL
ncbi:MAG TPA: hypothetical protein VLT47_15970, partial [Anaeromyxobacteraceae bacterium]|nr:hypothetical protein [Anaeromyxobacteraceae bacterium]